MPHSSLPLELVREIANHVVACRVAPLSSSADRKDPWFSINALSRSCRAYRVLALEAWFYVLCADSGDFKFLTDGSLPEVRTVWTREMHCTSHNSSATKWDLTGFTRLHTIRWHSPPARVRDELPFRNLPEILELDIRDLKWPSPFLFYAVSGRFPDLRRLRLLVDYIWCGLCHLCSSAEFAEPVPASIVYMDGLGLPIHYSQSLSALSHLSSVSIQVPYSPGASIHLDAKDPMRDLWAGECDSCVAVLYPDEAFREQWKARKQGLLKDSSQDARKQYVKPPALERVEWIFVKSEKDGDYTESDEDAVM